MFCFFSTQEETAKRQQLLAEHYESLPVPEFNSRKPKQHLIKQHKVAFCSRRVFQARPHNSKNVVLHLVLQSGASKEVPSWLPPHHTGWEQVCWCGLSPVPPETLRAEAGPSPSAKGILLHLVHSLTLGPVRPRGTMFAEQAAIQYFVFSSLFNVWPQAKPCSEYRTSGFLTGFLTGSLKAVARQLTSTFIAEHPCFPNHKLKKQRNQSHSFSSLWASLWRPPRAWFSGPLYMFKAQLLLMPLAALHHQHFCSSNPRLIPWKKNHHEE